MSTLLATRSPAGGRLITLRVVAVGYALFAAVASFGLPSLLLSWSTSGDELPLRTAYVVWGVLAGLLVPGLALAVLRRPATAALQALAGLVVASLLVLLVGFKVQHLEYVAAVALPAAALLALHPDARLALRRGGPVLRIPFAVVAVMVLPACWYAVDLALTSRVTRVLDTPSGEYTVHGQYAQAAVLALALLLAAAVGCVRQPGQAVVVALVTGCAAVVAVAGLLFPGDLIGIGSTWGTVTLAAAATYAAGAWLGRAR